MGAVCSTQIIMTDKVTLRSGNDAAYVAFQILPKWDKQGFFVNSSSFLTVGIKETDSEENLRVLTIKGENKGSEVLKGFVSVSLDDGTKEECEVIVLPELVSAPRFVKTPEIVFKDGKAIIMYDFEHMADNIDETEISWYRIDKVDRSRFKQIHFSKKSNEKDGRKIAVSKNNIPCREIRLTSADIGKHLKVNIKPKHNNSYRGQGLNVNSAIVKASDVDSGLVRLNTATVVEDFTYDMEPGFFTMRGEIGSEDNFLQQKKYGLVTKTMGCGIYYNHEGLVGDMSLVVILEPELKDGNGFEGPHQYDEIYIKYDPVEQNGYGLRISGRAAKDGKATFALYQYKNGNGIPISEEYVSDAFKPGCEVNLTVKADVINAFITYDDGDDFADVEIKAKIKQNDFGGFGFKHMAEVTEGYRVVLKYMEARYKLI